MLVSLMAPRVVIGTARQRSHRTRLRPALVFGLLLLVLAQLSYVRVYSPSREEATTQLGTAKPAVVPVQTAQPQRLPAPASQPPARLNVLLILIDDLRPVLGCYGDTLASTPNIDGLSREAVRFEAAYASVATCCPSRTSLLTGLRPDTHGVFDLDTHFRTTVPHATTLPQLFRSAGYLSLSYGKIFHENLDDEPSWSSQADFNDGEVWRGTNSTYGRDWWCAWEG